jgi:hypothetical protein
MAQFLTALTHQGLDKLHNVFSILQLDDGRKRVMPSVVTAAIGIQ